MRNLRNKDEDFTFKYDRIRPDKGLVSDTDKELGVVIVAACEGNYSLSRITLYHDTGSNPTDNILLDCWRLTKLHWHACFAHAPAKRVLKKVVLVNGLENKFVKRRGD